MTAQQPPRANPANQAANAKSCSDSRSATGTCPLMKAKVQLVPVRYGLVEHLDPSAALATPYKLKSRPLGIRLLRPDGFLYIIDEQTGYLHEYKIEQGAPSQLLWQGKDVAANTRTSSVGPANLLFSRQSTLYACYSEVQWTAAKCSQVLKSRDERRHFMQRIDLAQANPETGAQHLLTWQQAERWLAEAAENQAQPDEDGTMTLPPVKVLPEGAHPQETQAYPWEQPALFRESKIDALKAKVLPAYRHDSLCLVLKDDIGLLRDLANFQDSVVGWLEEWAEGGAQQYANERDY